MISSALWRCEQRCRRRVDDGVVDDDTEPKATIDRKHTPTTSGGDSTYKMHTEF